MSRTRSAASPRIAALAAEAGRKGGRAVKPQHRSFAQNRALAAAAGRKGGQTSQSRRIGAHYHNDDRSNGNGTGP